MTEYTFYAQQKIGTCKAATKENARDIFITQSFEHLLELRKRYHPDTIVRSVNPANARDTILFIVDDVELERWQLRPSSSIKRLIRRLIGD